MPLRVAGRSTPVSSHNVGSRSVAWAHWSRRPAPATAPGPVQDERHRVAAHVGVDLVEPERRVRRHRPAPRVVDEGLRSAGQVDAVAVELRILEVLHVLRHEGAEVGRRAARLALARGAVVGQEHEDRVVGLAQLLERGVEAPDRLVDAVDHRREDLHVPGVERLVGAGRGCPTAGTSSPGSRLRGGSGVPGGSSPSSSWRS